MFILTRLSLGLSVVDHVQPICCVVLRCSEDIDSGYYTIITRPLETNMVRFKTQSSPKLMTESREGFGQFGVNYQ